MSRNAFGRGSDFVRVEGNKPSTKATKRGALDRRGVNTMLVVDEPDWMKTLRSDSLLNSRDIVALFGFNSASAIHQGVREGSFPDPDVIISGVKSSHQWRVRTIRVEIERRKLKSQGEEQQ